MNPKPNVTRNVLSKFVSLTRVDATELLQPTAEPLMMLNADPSTKRHRYKFYGEMHPSNKYSLRLSLAFLLSHRHIKTSPFVNDPTGNVKKFPFFLLLP